MAFQDHFSRQADLYTRFRPRYPADLYRYLASLPAQPRRAWDCGTGNGQAAVGLADCFDEVVATDPSLRQIEHAELHARVEYLVASAEHGPLEGESIDLVAVAQAVHWFELTAFYDEVRRVGRAGSVIALWTYGLATINSEVDLVVGRLYEDVLGKYWPPERRMIEERYQTLAFPFAEIPVPEFTMTAQWDLAELLGYLSTWSSAQRYLDEHGTSAVEQMRTALAEAWGATEERREVCWPLVLRAGRIRDD